MIRELSTNSVCRSSNHTMSEPYWHALIRFYEVNGFIANGLTIPYLIGARSIITHNQHLYSITELITEVSIYGGTMLKCGCLHEFVIGSQDNENKHHYLYFDNLIVSDDSLHKYSTLGEIIELLENLYANKIDSGLFSKEEGEWSGFNSDDEVKLNKFLVHNGGKIG